MAEGKNSACFYLYANQGIRLKHFNNRRLKWSAYCY